MSSRPMHASMRRGGITPASGPSARSATSQAHSTDPSRGYRLSSPPSSVAWGIVSPPNAHASTSVLLSLRHAYSSDTVLTRSEEHTSELQSRLHLVCRLLLEKKK